jgi:hypothetical protein
MWWRVGAYAGFCFDGQPTQAVIPAAGLCLAWVALQVIGRGATPATADEYIANFHDRRRPLPASRAQQGPGVGGDPSSPSPWPITLFGR